jgi:exo-beta-1,3-glucanase (GH17 family)
MVLLLAGLVVLAWWWPNRPRAGDVAMPDARFNSVSFAPFRAGQSPLDHRFPSAAEVEEDMAVIAPRTRAIRTYAAIEGDYDVAALAAKHGLKVWQGIWLGTDRAKNAAEIARGIALAKRYPETIERVVVGNEVLLRRDLPVGELIAAIDQVRAAVRQPVTYADVWEFWRQFPEVAPHVDVVTIHLLPYWEDQPTGIDGAVQHVDAVYRAMAKLFPGKPIAIGETGWPSRGRPRQDAVPGRVEQAVFLRRFIALARQEGFDYNLIEAFDQGWKYKSEGTVGANWGLWTADRQPKFPLSGPVVENPDWARYAAGGVAAGLALLALALSPLSSWPGLTRPSAGTTTGFPPESVQPIASHGRVKPGHDAVSRMSAQFRLAFLAMALGGALSFAWAGTVPVIYDARLLVAAIGNLAGQVLLAALMMRRAAGILAGVVPPPARTGADATETVLARLRLRPGRRITAASVFDDLSFVFVWTAAVMQLLLLFDPRYRDFPLPVFAVPLACVIARALLADLPRGGGGREEFWAGATLAIAAVAGAVMEGPANHASLAWSLAALVLAAPPLLRVRRRARVPATV